MKRIFIWFVLLLGALSSCEAPPCPTSFKGTAMTIDYQIQIGDPLSSQDELKVLAIANDVFNKINQVFNKWNPQSELSQVNAAPANQPLLLSQELTDFLQDVGRLVSFSEGRFDPTIEPLERLWKLNLQLGQIPSEQELADLAPAIGWHHIHLAGNLFWKEHPLTSIDLSGVVKGHAIDLLAQELTLAGFKNIYVEWGGEIKAQGNHPSGRPWKIAIAGHSPKIPLRNQAIATSGNYLQNWNVGGICYTHIIDPRTQIPLKVEKTSISSASVLSDSCKEADALATALMLFPTQEEASLWAKENNLKVWIFIPTIQ